MKNILSGYSGRHTSKLQLYPRAVAVKAVIGYFTPNYVQFFSLSLLLYNFFFN